MDETGKTYYLSEAEISVISAPMNIFIVSSYGQLFRSSLQLDISSEFDDQDFTSDESDEAITGIHWRMKPDELGCDIQFLKSVSVFEAFSAAPPSESSSEEEITQFNIDEGMSTALHAISNMHNACLIFHMLDFDL